MSELDHDPAAAVAGEPVELEFEDDADVEPDEGGVPPDRRQLVTQAADPEVETLVSRAKRGSLILQPMFQRQYVWDTKKASRLIESALLGVPIPIIYLAEEADNTVSVIDGQQRLTAFFTFVDGKHPDGSAFRLRGLEVFDELNGRSFDKLPKEHQDTLMQYALRTITIKRQSDPDVKFRIFERLNTGSVPLNDMELRNCVYRGRYMELLKELAGDETFRKLLGLKDYDRRMKDVALVLRFAAFAHVGYVNYERPMKRFFNNDMERFRNLSGQDAEELRARFRNACQIVWSIFGPSAFRRFYAGGEDNPNGRWETKSFNASLYDVLMGVLCKADKNQAMAALDRLREAVIDLMVSNAAFIEAITIGTSDVERVTTRFDIVRATVAEVLKDVPVQPRCFTRELKQQLYDANPTCGLCGQHIAHLDDAAVDHVEQYWRGGQTIPENARLAHRYCNLVRPKDN